MGTTFKKLIETRLPSIEQKVANELCKLDGHVILSRGDYPYRFNILDLHHKIYLTKIMTKNNEEKLHPKEWSFGHLMILSCDVYFSERPTSNRDVKKHSVASKIYSKLNSYEFFDIDRHAKLINSDNVEFIVDEILKLTAIGLIP